MQRVLVTGASGFIGSHLVRLLQEQGVEIRCLVRASSRTSHLDTSAVELYTGDLGDVDSLRRSIANVDTVLHLAGLTKSLRKQELWEVNELGTRNVAQACADQPSPPVLVVVSSLAAAGPAVPAVPSDPERESVAFPERVISGFRPRNESDRLAPVSNYGRSKLAGERAAVQHSDQLPISIIRPPIVFGPTDRDSLELFKPFTRFGFHLIPGTRPAPFSVIHAEDLAKAILVVAKQGQRCRPADEVAGTYFTSAPQVLSYRELGEMIADAVGEAKARCVPMPAPLVRSAAAVNEAITQVLRRPHIFNWDKSREAIAGGWACNSTKLIRECDFAFDFDLQTRLKQTADAYREQGWL